MDEEEEQLIGGTVVDTNLTDVATNITLNWASEWLGYIALCMFSLVLLVPTLGIVGLMAWEYFSDEAERKAERQKEIETAMQQHFGDKKNDFDEENEEDDSDDNLRDVDDVLKQADTILHKRHRAPKSDSSPNDFDEILT